MACVFIGFIHFLMHAISGKSYQQLGFEDCGAIMPIVLIGVSIIIDVIIIYIIKELFKKLLNSYSKKILLWAFLFYIVLAVVLSIIPVITILSYSHNIQNNTIIVSKNYNSLMHFPFIAKLGISNLFSTFPLIILIIVCFGFFVHKMLWPIIIRPLYTFQRFGIFDHRIKVAILGVVIFYFAIIGSWNEFLHFVLKEVHIK